MTEADGSIRIPTKVDLAGLKKGLAEVKKELAQTEKEYEKLAKEYESEASKYEKAISQGGPEGAKALEQQIKVAEKYGVKLDALLEKINKYKAALSSAESYHDRMSGATNASNQVDQAMANDKFVSSINTQEKYRSLLSQTRSEMARIEAHAARISAETGASVNDILRQNDAYQNAASKAKLLETRSKDIRKNIKNAKKETKGLGDATKSGIAGFGKMGLALMAIRFAMRAIGSAAREYMAVNTKLEEQMNTLKALWGQVLGPVIEGFINLLIKAISYVNEFVVALTGINYIARANEAALKKQAKATSGAAKAAQLAGFDEQTKLNDPSSGSDGVTLLDETLANVPAFVERMKEMMLAGDWFGAGKVLGEEISEGIRSIDWEGVGTKVGEFLGGSLEFLLGLFLNIDYGSVVKGWFEAVSGWFNALSESLQTLDWFSIGSKIVDIILSTITSLFSPEAQSFVNAAAEFVGSFIGALASAIAGAGMKIAEFVAELFYTIKTYFDGCVNWEGTPGEIIESLLLGIWEAIKDIGQWLYDNVWIPFRDGFMEAFDIHSPSNKMAEFGTMIIEGLCNGITGAINKVKQACTDILTAIKEKFNNIGTWFKEKFSDAWSKVKDVFSTGGKIFDGIKDGIASTFKTIVNGLIGGINKVIAVPFNAINSMLNTIRGISVLGVSPFKGLWSYNPLSVPQIPKLAVGGIVNRPGRGVPAIIGEAGAEAVLPLENNTEWMDILADKIGGNVTIPIYMDGKKIATYVVDIQKKKAFAMNGA